MTYVSTTKLLAAKSDGNWKNTFRIAGAASAIALAVAFTLIPANIQQARAGNECLLDTDPSMGALGAGDDVPGNGDTDGGATTNNTGIDLACGTNAQAFGTPVEGATAVGTDTTATGGNATAVGDQANSVGEDSSALGGDAVATGDNTTAVGARATATDANSTAVGQGANAQNGSTAVGQGANAINSTALGMGATATGTESTAVGEDSSATGDFSTAIGEDSVASAFTSTALGNDAEATMTQSTALGVQATASGFSSTATGAFSNASASNATANGFTASALATESTALGAGSNVGMGATNGTAVGQGATVAMGATNATAVGQGANAAANGASAFGQNAQATGSQSTAIGTNATATLPNQMVFGTATETYTTPGITSATSLARQAGPLQVVTTDAAGNLASDGGALFSQINQNLDQIRENRDGVAMAMALGSFWVPDGKVFAASANVGAFNGSTAIAGQMGVNLTEDLFADGSGVSVHVTGGVAYGFKTNEVGGRAGVLFSF